jgi:tRNA-specific adenosine deaminase 2
MEFTITQKSHMKEAIKVAQECLEIGEVPVGCVIVCDDQIIARGGNRTNLTCNATRHAEFEALETILSQSDDTNETVDLSLCELYVTVEPCIMCAAALARVGISKVYFGCHNDKFGGTGSIMSLHQPDAPLPSFASTYTCYSGLLKEEAINLLRRFYEMGNPHAPKPQRLVVQPQQQQQHYKSDILVEEK